MFEIFARKRMSSLDGMNILAAEMVTSECLKYAHEKGCPWDEVTCSNAAKNGHLKCLKYAHENGCPWDKETCKGLPKEVTSSV